MQFMQRQRTNVASSANKLQSNSSFLDPFSRLVAPKKTNETITLSTSHILYGWHDRTKHWQALNYCLLIAKYCIYCTSLRGDVLDFQSFLFVITGKLEILKEIATVKKALTNFYRTWAVFSCVSDVDLEVKRQSMTSL